LKCTLEVLNLAAKEFADKAEENFLASRILFEKELYNASASRAYFASFQFAIAILKKSGIESEKNEHDWVQSTFNRELIYRRGIFPQRIRSYLMDLQKIRNLADYSSVCISKKIAYRQIKKVEELFNLKGENI
jgi:uncharacterized protein (UPF0332 family)